MIGRTDGDGAGADDERVVGHDVVAAVVRCGRAGGAVGCGDVDAGGGGVQPQLHAGGFQVGGGAVGEVAPVGDLAGDVVGDAADGEVRVGVGDDDGDVGAWGRVRGRAGAALMPASLPPMATRCVTGSPRVRRPGRAGGGGEVGGDGVLGGRSLAGDVGVERQDEGEADDGADELGAR